MLRFSPEWQVAFLRKAEPRAARPETCPTSNASRLSPAQRCQERLSSGSDRSTISTSRQSVHWEKDWGR